jgi:hypothetical protein
MPESVLVSRQSRAIAIQLAASPVFADPALTAVGANPVKPLNELRCDRVVIVLLQVAAIAYGFHTVALLAAPDSHVVGYLPLDGFF